MIINASSFMMSRIIHLAINRLFIYRPPDPLKTTLYDVMVIQLSSPTSFVNQHYMHYSIILHIVKNHLSINLPLIIQSITRSSFYRSRMSSLITSSILRSVVIIFQLLFMSYSSNTPQTLHYPLCYISVAK